MAYRPRTNHSDAYYEKNHIIVSWDKKLSTGIDMLDNQHKKLVAMTNQLYRACIRGGDSRDAVFKETMSQMVEYVRKHFATEQELFVRVKYPKAAEHKLEHDNLIKKILDTAKDYADDRNSAANEFVRSLKDWIVSHIGHSDRLYGIYVAEQKKKGLLNSRDISG